MKVLNAGALFLLLMTALCGCERRDQSTLVGFIGGLSTKTSDVGVMGRDGTLLAFEEFNLKQGHARNQVELVVYDDAQNPVRGRKAFRDLKEKGAVAVVGPMTSSMCEAIWPLANESVIPIVSPTCSSVVFDGHDDAFFRVYPTCRKAAKKLAAEARGLGLEHVTVLVDLANESFTRYWASQFTDEFTANGHGRVSQVTFHSKQKIDYFTLAQNISGAKPDGVLILANPTDTGLVAQQFAKLGNIPQLLVSEWSLSGDLNRYSGVATGHIIGVQNIHPEQGFSTRPDFYSRFKARFGREPNFAAAFGYDAAQVLLRALTTKGEDESLVDALRKTGQVDGVINQFTMDRLGDVERPVYLVTNKNGELIGI
ncbi:MAG: hypothetical protein C0616_04855 [Desulfuromonas sp.]|nr:MAG: hypothetical protein C0616_04855 [Desulfuromonas sp.]